jgi:teichuronic acid biosynthesis glycosyltransferase TuaC
MRFMKCWATYGTRFGMVTDAGGSHRNTLVWRRQSLSLLTATTLFPNPVQRAHGVFVETRLRKLLATGEVAAQVVAPVPWLPSFMTHPSLGAIHRVPTTLVRDDLTIHHPRYLVIPKIGMTLTPSTLFRAMRGSLQRILQSGQRIDMIDAHYFYPDGVAAVRLAHEFKIPVVVTARGTDLNLIPNFLVARSMIQRAAARADGLVTVCQALKDRLVELGVPAGRIHVLRNGVDLDVFYPIDRDRARNRLGLRRRTLGSVGQLIERKGHHHAIRALVELPDTELIVVGSGPDRDSLERLSTQLGVNDRVRFMGAVDQLQLHEIYNAIDALVLASSREGWANVLLEAMACGTPVAASPVWGTPEVVTAPEAGVLMPTVDAAGVVAAITKLFQQPIDRNATRHYAERFDWAPTTAGQLALFREILAQRTGRQPNCSA